MNDGKLRLAILTRDAQKIMQTLDAGFNPAWTDENGRTLLHFAAALGNDALIERLLTAGVKPEIVSNAGLRANDIARLWGYADVAAKLRPQLSFTAQSLDDVRKSNGGIYRAIADGFGVDVIKLAEKDSVGLTAADLLATQPLNDTALLCLCRQEIAKKLFTAGLWRGRAEEMMSVWAEIPAAARKDIDIDQIAIAIHQRDLQAGPKTRPAFRRAP